MVSEQDYPRQQMVWSDWCGWYIPASASARHPWPSRSIASSSSSLSGYGGGPYRQEMGVIGLGSSACKIPSRFQSESALEPYLPRQIPDSSDLRRRRGLAELALAVSGPAGGGSDRGGVKVPGSTPAKIPNPSFDLGNMTKSMVRYEAVATDPTAVWRIASTSNWRPSEEPKDLPDLVPSAEWENEKARRSVELRRITPMSTQGKQGMGAPEGNFNPPSTGCSAVPSGWSQNQLPPACPVFPNLNNFNPSHGPELARQCPQYPREIRNQCPFQYQAIQWNLNSGNGSEKDALSAMGKNADSNEVDEIQKDEPALKGSDAKTKSNDPTEAPSQPVETNVKTEEMGDRPGKDWVVVRGPEEDNSKMFEAEGDEAKKENAEEKKGVNELGEEDKINKDDVVKTIVQHNLINYLIEGDEIENALKALGLNGSTIQGAHLPFTNSSNVVGHVVEKSFDRQDRGFRGTRLLWTLPPWPGFCTMNCDRFAQHCEYEVIEKFYSVKLYNHSFLYYIDRFEELIKIWPIMNEDYYARVEGREIISNLSKVTGLATMSAALRLGLDNIDENVRNTIAWALSVMASALDTSALLSFLKTVCQSKKSWQVRHTDIKVVQQTAILMGCTDLPHLKSLVEISEHGLSDENPKVQTITALVEAVAPYGIESFNTVWKPPWKGIRSHLGKVLAAYLINEELSIDKIKLTPLKLLKLIASIKNGNIRGRIGKEILDEFIAKGRTVKSMREESDLVHIADPAAIEAMDKKNNLCNMSVIAHVDHGKSTLTDSLVTAVGIIAQEVAGDIYGVLTAPRGQWFSRPCKTNTQDIVCILCGYGGGAMTEALKAQNTLKSLLKGFTIAARSDKYFHSSGNASKEGSSNLYGKDIQYDSYALDITDASDELGLFLAMAKRSVESAQLKRIRLIMMPLRQVLSKSHNIALISSCLSTWNYILYKLGDLINYLSILGAVFVPVLKIISSIGLDNANKPLWSFCINLFQELISVKFRHMTSPGEYFCVPLNQNWLSQSYMHLKTLRDIQHIRWLSWVVTSFDFQLEILGSTVNLELLQNTTHEMMVIVMDSATQIFWLLLQGVDCKAKSTYGNIQICITKACQLVKKVFLDLVGKQNSDNCAVLVQFSLQFMKVIAEELYHSLLVSEQYGICVDIEHKREIQNAEYSPQISYPEIRLLSYKEMVSPAIYMTAVSLSMVAQLTGELSHGHAEQLALVLCSFDFPKNALGGIYGVLHQKEDLYVKSVHHTVIWMGKKKEYVEDVPCGNTVTMVGLDQFIIKNATLINVKELDNQNSLKDLDNYNSLEELDDYNYPKELDSTEESEFAAVTHTDSLYEELNIRELGKDALVMASETGSAKESIALQSKDSFKENPVLAEQDVDDGPIITMKFYVFSVGCVTVQCMLASDLPKFVKSLKRLARSDHMILCPMEELGEHICAVVGEFHFEICLKYLLKMQLERRQILSKKHSLSSTLKLSNHDSQKNILEGKYAVEGEEMSTPEKYLNAGESYCLKNNVSPTSSQWSLHGPDPPHSQLMESTVYISSVNVGLSC